MVEHSVDYLNHVRHHPPGVFSSHNPKINSPMRILSTCLFTGFCLTASLSAQNLLTNAGFERGMMNWVTFIPAESVAQAPVLEIAKGSAHTGTSALRLTSTTSSRFAIGNYPWIPVVAGERFRVSAWYRIEPGAVAKATLPGFVMRLNFKQDDAPAGTPTKHLYAGPSGAISSGVGPQLVRPALPTEWTLIEAVVEVPANTNIMSVNFFSWGLTGAVLVDDALIEKVAADVAPTVLAGSP